jgi:hypothetical protein
LVSSGMASGYRHMGMWLQGLFHARWAGSLEVFSFWDLLICYLPQGRAGNLVFIVGQAQQLPVFLRAQVIKLLSPAGQGPGVIKRKGKKIKNPRVNMLGWHDGTVPNKDSHVDASDLGFLVSPPLGSRQ